MQYALHSRLKKFPARKTNAKILTTWFYFEYQLGTTMKSDTFSILSSKKNKKLNVPRTSAWFSMGYLPDLRPGSVLISLAGTGNIVEDEGGSLLLLSVVLGVGLLATVGSESFSEINK